MYLGQCQNNPETAERNLLQPDNSYVFLADWSSSFTADTLFSVIGCVRKNPGMAALLLFRS